jgi:hypothetical protein
MVKRMRIIFRGNDTVMHDDKHNNDLTITGFVDYLRQFGIWQGYMKVPDTYYQAWKILILGTNEYDNHAFDIIKNAQENWLSGKA